MQRRGNTWPLGPIQSAVLPLAGANPHIDERPSRPAADIVQFRIGGVPLSAILFLVLTAVIALLTSHYRLIHGDDLLELWDDAHNLSQVIHIQRVMPLVIDPFFYHGIIFALLHLFGLRPSVLILPSLLGFLLMQLCLFQFVRRIASERSAVFALGFMAVTPAVAYAVQIRPYGVLLGLCGVMMLNWQTAIRRETHRTLALATLAISIALAINTHFYGALFLIPLGIAELFRTYQRKQVDAPVIVSMIVGMLGIILILPFLKGAAAFRINYVAGAISYPVITQTYIGNLISGSQWFTLSQRHILAVGLGLFLLLILWGCLRQLRRRSTTLPGAEFVFLVTVAALPFFCFLLSRWVTHAMEPRYALSSVIGVVALLAIALDPLLRKGVVGRVLLLALFVWLTCRGIVDIRSEKNEMRSELASLVLSPEIRAAIMASPSKTLYTQDIDLLGFASYHDPDAAVLSHMALVYSMDEEMRRNHSATDTRMILHLKSFEPYTIVPYESLKTQPGNHIFVVTSGGWNWIDKAFAAEHVRVVPIGRAFGAEVVSVCFAGACAPGTGH